jgi:membrane protease YdiL (CAAX protease family)
VAGFSASDAVQLLVFEAAIVVVTLVRPIARVGYTFDLSRHDVVTAGAAFAAFAVIAIPVGLATGFIEYGWRPFDALEWGREVSHFVFQVALTEELVFRGLLQNGLERLGFAARRWPRALVITALIFGAAHLGHPPVPNWLYGILATLAGIAYGWVWHRTGKITAAALTHAAVDLVWVLAFGGP